MGALLQDVRYGIRMMLKNPAFTLVAVLTLALGMGANTAIFSVVNTVLLQPAPLADMDRLMMVWETDRNSGTAREPASAPDFLDFQRESRRFERMAAFMGAETNLTGADGTVVRLAGLAVTHDFFATVGVNPVAGRVFTLEEDRQGGPRVAMISEQLWQERFRRAPDITGQKVRLDEVDYQIVGVLPRLADFGVLQVLSSAAYSRSFADRGERVEADVWLPLRPDQPGLVRDTHPLFVIGRLKAGATPEEAQAEMAGIAATLEQQYRQANDGRGVFVEPLSQVVLGNVRTPLLVLLAGVTLVLLVACVNVTNLLLARSAARAREIATRAALGARTWQLARQLLAEGTVLALAGGAAGILFASWGTSLLAALAPATIPRIHEVTINGQVLAVTLAVALTVGIVLGLAPLARLRATELQASLRLQPGHHLSSSGGRGRLRAALVIAEVSLTMVLVLGAGLLIKSFWRLMQVDPGFRAAGVLKAEFQLPESRYPVDFRKWPDFAEIHRFNRAVLERAAATPGVEAAAIAGNHPLDPGFTNSFAIVGREAEAQSWPEISIRRVTPGYFSVLDVRLVRGRLLAIADETTAPPVAVINEAATRRFFGESDPLGHKIRFWGTDRTIVGVIANERFQGLASEAPVAVYVPLAQAPSANGAGTLLLRVQGDPSVFLGPARQAVTGVDPGLAVYGVEPLSATLAGSVAQRRFTMLLLGSFAALALLLAMLGVYGVLSYTSAQRTPEIAIRMALGASRWQVLLMVIADGVRLAVAGTALGVIGGLAAGQAMRTLLFGVTATDPVTFAGVSVAIFVVALAASFIPARRATKVDPMVALRYE